MTKTNLAPAQSAPIRALLDITADAAEGGEPCDARVLREILWLITAHPELLGFGMAAGRLIDIIDRIHERWPSEVKEAKIGAWHATLDWLGRHETRIAQHVGPQYSRRENTSGNNPVRGSGSADFAFYAVLCEPLPDGPGGERFLLLSGQLLVTYVIAAREHSVIDDYETHGPALKWNLLPNRAEGACRAVRRLTEPRGKTILDNLPVELHPEKFAEQLEDEPIPDDPDLKRDHDNLLRFLQKVWCDVEWRATAGGGGGGGGGHKWVGGRLEGSRLTIEPYGFGTDGDPAGAWGSIDIVKFSATSTRKRNQLVASDLSPDEAEGDDEILLSDFDCELTKQDPGALARTAQAKARHTARANQLFPWAYERLSYEEVKRLIDTIQSGINNLLGQTIWTRAALIDAQRLFALVVMLMTGSSIERAARIRVIHRDGDHDVELGLRIRGTRPFAQLEWYVPALTPQYRTDWSADTGQFRAHAKAITYSDYFDLAALLERLIPPGNMPPSSNRSPYRMALDSLATHVRDWLKAHDPDGRVTAEKIEHFLWSRIHHFTRDPAIASCVTGVPHPLSRVRLHYTSPLVSKLQQLYRDAFRPLFPVDKHVSPPQDDLAPHAATGARLCPTLDAVRGMFEQLQRDITASRSYTDRAGFARHHNLLTLYTVQFFAYATSCRAIITPYLHLHQIDRARGIASLSDKDDESRHKTRLVWIPPLLLAQMQQYEAHLDALKAEPFEFPAPLRAEPCLLLNERDLTPQLVRPRTLEPLLARYLNVRANTHRRLLRTELTERGCPTEVVDAFMGHWSSGEEPFHVFSSFSFGDYVRELSGHLQRLLDDIGLNRVMAGSLADPK